MAILHDRLVARQEMSAVTKGRGSKSRSGVCLWKTRLRVSGGGGDEVKLLIALFQCLIATGRTIRLIRDIRTLVRIFQNRLLYY